MFQCKKKDKARAFVQNTMKQHIESKDVKEMYDDKTRMRNGKSFLNDEIHESKKKVQLDDINIINDTTMRR